MSTEPIPPPASSALYADIGGVYEVSVALNVNIYRVRRWIERRESTNCPRPVRMVRGAHLYSLNEWRAWFYMWMLTRGTAPHGSGPGRSIPGLKGIPTL